MDDEDLKSLDNEELVEIYSSLKALDEECENLENEMKGDNENEIND